MVHDSRRVVKDRTAGQQHHRRGKNESQIEPEDDGADNQAERYKPTNRQNAPQK